MACAEKSQDIVKWTDQAIDRELELLEDHKKNYQCRDCMRKHCTLIEGFCMENALFTGKSKYIKLARKMMLFRKSLGDGGTPA